MKLHIYAKDVTIQDAKGKSKTFLAYSVKMTLPLSNTDKTVSKWITLKFRKDVDVSGIRSGHGLLTVTDEQLDAPFAYKVFHRVSDRRREEVLPVIAADGSYSYELSLFPKDSVEWPTVWIREFESYVPVIAKHSQTAFDDGFTKKEESLPEGKIQEDDHKLPF